ncbi:hypothetical protein BC834DRAFT_898710 [Gloeopeniophorella convolvens]|nr:hypothetical protein BC834DRAFT_898710 [Gloeopeniophorella convolvens]
MSHQALPHDGSWPPPSGHKRAAPSGTAEESPLTKRLAIETPPQHTVTSPEPSSQDNLPGPQAPAASLASLDPKLAVTTQQADETVISHLGQSNIDHVLQLQTGTIFQWILRDIVHSVILANPAILDQKLADVSVLSRVLEQHPQTYDIAVQCLKSGSFDELRHLEWLRIPVPLNDVPALEDPEESKSRQVTEEAWKVPYKGNGAVVFQHHLRRCNNPKSMQPYARVTVIVQSSGMGKSRMVDEVSKALLTIPINLGSGSTGYPPPDTALRDWLCNPTGIKDASPSKSQTNAAARCHAFLASLLRALLSHLEDLLGGPNWVGRTDFGYIAFRFREKMIEDQSFVGHGSYRKKFYEKVVSGADEIPKSTQDYVPASPTLSYPGSASAQAPSALMNAAAELMDALDQRFLKPRDENDPLSDPIVLLAFDESHELANLFGHSHQDEGWVQWTMYSELRRVLRQILPFPIFSVFLSTTGKFSSFAPPAQLDPSARIQKSGLKVLTPYSETSFDGLAIKVADDGYLRLDQVASLNHIASLGRPLFSSRYSIKDWNVQSNIVNFALDKLLGGGPFVSSVKLTSDQTLACLSVRLPLEFLPGSPLADEKSRIQVEKHMRVCLSADPGFDGLLTVAPSEPLLAEAAKKALEIPQYIAPMALSEHLQNSGLSTGSRGELAAALLLLTARDDALAGSTEGYTVPVVRFLESLIGKGVRGDGVRPFRANDNDVTSGKAPLLTSTPLRDTFKNSHIWFNHFVKVQSEDLLNRCYLWRHIVRGAAICCAVGQRGVDFVIPFIYHDKVLASCNVSAILIQVKNDKKVKRSIRAPILDAIDPFIISLFSKKSQQPPLPILRMVFALGSNKSAVRFRNPPSRRSPRRTPDQFTTYDIWCAGAFPGTFPVIRNSDQRHYKTILEMQGIAYDPYTAGIPADAPVGGIQEERPDLRRMMNPGTGLEDEFFSQYVDLSKSTCDDLGTEVSAALEDDDMEEEVEEAEEAEYSGEEFEGDEGEEEDEDE